MATVSIRIVGQNYASRDIRRVTGDIESLVERTQRLTQKFFSLRKSTEDTREGFSSLATAFKWYTLWWGISRVQKAFDGLVTSGYQAVKEYELGTFALQNLVARQLRESSAIKERVKIGEKRVHLTEQERLKLKELQAQLHKTEGQAAQLAGQLI